IGSALKPLMENQELRRLLSSADEEEKRGWLKSASELGITLLSGVEETAEWERADIRLPGATDVASERTGHSTDRQERGSIG
ncbi:hypothetical protein PZ740_13790, partial [Rhodospirillales bacterium YIM 152171]|nr:hypothetical protein [Marinimicrococcus flavescens]